MSQEQRYKKIFSLCFNFLKDYDKNVPVTESDWKKAADYLRTNTDYNDNLAMKISLACYLELADRSDSKAGDYHTKQTILKNAIIELAKQDAELWESLKNVFETVNQQMSMTDKAV